MDLYTYHDTYVNKDGETKHCNRVYVVDAEKHKFVRIQATFPKNDGLALAMMATSVNGLDDVIRAAGLVPDSDTKKK